MSSPNHPTFWAAWRLIARREYITRFRRKAFLLATFLGPVLLVGMVASIVLLTQGTEEEVKVYVVDLDGLLTVPGPQGSLVPWCPSCFPERRLLTYRFGREAKTKPALEADGFTCMIMLDEGIVQSEKGQLLQVNPPSSSAKRSMERDLSQALERLKVREELEVDYDAYMALKTDIQLVPLDIDTKERKGSEQGALGFLFSVFMFMFVMIYGMHVMRGVIEEKSNRIVEVVLSTVQPLQLLLGKIAGIGALGLTQIATWSLLSWSLMFLLGLGLEKSAWLESWTAAQGMAAGTADFQTVLAAQEELAFLLDIDWGVMLGCAAIYFVLGYALYAAFFAMIGSMVEQESDAQYLLLPVMLPMLFSYILASMSIEAPESTLAVVSSFVPFSSPISMMVRLPMGVPWWHVVVSMLLLLATTALLLALAARVYRVTILMTGKRPTFRAVVRWMFSQSHV
ncbi:MAG: ABC transporter permease [Bacteroidetes bacterium]|nr:ABC transporter permease [Bacteroidota bacterium]MDA0903931.1 ABC transporter permease [Bacteroidota bacterium]MDA1242777.1 ABC transporter permease [Bacteroidota bacterium]